MGRHYSNDLRERVAAAVLSGRSCREVAALFSVSVASAVKWSQRLRQTGRAGPCRSQAARAPAGSLSGAASGLDSWPADGGEGFDDAGLGD